jgi:hypothetical protein
MHPSIGYFTTVMYVPLVKVQGGSDSSRPSASRGRRRPATVNVGSDISRRALPEDHPNAWLYDHSDHILYDAADEAAWPMNVIQAIAAAYLLEDIELSDR